MQYADSLTNAFTDIVRSIENEMDSSPYGQSSAQSFIENVPTTNNARYYRIKVAP